MHEANRTFDDASKKVNGKGLPLSSAAARHRTELSPRYCSIASTSTRAPARTQEADREGMHRADVQAQHTALGTTTDQNSLQPPAGQSRPWPWHQQEARGQADCPTDGASYRPKVASLRSPRMGRHHQICPREAWIRSAGCQLEPVVASQRLAPASHRLPRLG